MNLISIITVVLNDKNGFERTIQSIINQTYEKFQVIIIDGGSIDGTIDVIKKYEDRIDYWISEKDNGIYDAMNKGIKKTSGLWVSFINSGDTFSNNEVLKKVFNKNKFENYALIYGYKRQYEKDIFPLSIKMLEYGEIMACHQSMFFNKWILGDELQYNLGCKIYGDYELVNRIYLNKQYYIKYIQECIVTFEGGGISSIASFQKRKDKYLTLYRHYGLLGLSKGLLYRLLKVFRPNQSQY